MEYWNLKKQERKELQDMEKLKLDVKLYPDAYQYERAERFGVSQRGIALALKRLGISYKVWNIQKQEKQDIIRDKINKLCTLVHSLLI
jgi:hypothetical protein